MMRGMFSVTDADSDGTLSLQEFQAASERIFQGDGCRQRMAPLPWRKCRISCTVLKDRVPGGSLTSRIQSRDRALVTLELKQEPIGGTMDFTRVMLRASSYPQKRTVGK